MTCTSSNLTASAEEAWAYGHGTSGVGVWLRLRARGGESCIFAVRPSVVVDSGYGPAPAIDGTAEADADVVSGLLVPPSGLRLLVSWTSVCDGNHKAPVVRLLVGPQGDERVAVAGSSMPAALRAEYCWNDGVELGTKAWA
jgi:hypothetical protein